MNRTPCMSVLLFLGLLVFPLFGQAPLPLGPPPAPPSMVGGLQVIVNVPGVKVFVDGLPKGELTPPQVLNLADLPVGTVQVRVEAAGYQTRALNFPIQAGAWTQAVFVLVKQGGGAITPPTNTPAAAFTAQPAAPAPASVPARPSGDPAAIPGAAQNAQGRWELAVKAGPVSVVMVQIPSGRFRMGSATGDANEMPIHDVNLDKSFWIGKFPITQKQWQAVMGYNPSKFKSAGPEAPVENVSWNACESFLRRLNEKQSDWVFRLPSEAEWEYACKAGSTGMRYGDTLGDIAWFGANSGGTTHPVGQKQPNAWGLHDMLGNVWQWCADLQHDTYEGAPNDGTPWVTDSYFMLWGARITNGAGGSRYKPVPVTRGAAWDSGSEEVRSTNREMVQGDLPARYLGFRVVCVPR